MGSEVYKLFIEGVFQDENFVEMREGEKKEEIPLIVSGFHA